MPDKFVGESRHQSTNDAARINRAVEKAASDSSFIDSSLDFLRDLRFPAFKHAIYDHVKQIHAPEAVVALFESLDGYIEYHDLHQLRKSLEGNDPEKKKDYQVTDKTRMNQDVRRGDKGARTDVNASKASDEHDERKDYPEVNPTATSDFTCDKCGKAFQNQQDLIAHHKFETQTDAA